MCDTWFKSLDKGDLTGVVFLDIQKAFDSVNHEILLNKLTFYGIEACENSWFKSYLSNSYQRCLVNGFLSSSRQIECSVPQGSILGPLLFLLYINDLPNCLDHTIPCLYADDTQIYASSQNPEELTSFINSDLERIQDWLAVNKLQAHPSKTKVMFIGTSQNLKNKLDTTSNEIMFNGKIVTLVESQKCLGVTIDKTLDFKKHIDEVAKKACSGIGALK